VVFVASFFVGLGEIELLVNAGKAGDLGEMASIMEGRPKSFRKMQSLH